MPTGGVPWNKEPEHAYCTRMLQVQNATPPPSERLPPFQASHCEANANRARPRGARHSASSCLFSQTPLLLPDLLHIKGAVSLHHQNRRGNVSDVCHAGFLLLFVIVQNHHLALSGPTLASPHPVLPVPAPLSPQTATHRRSGLRRPEASPLERGRGRLSRPVFMIRQIYLLLPSDGSATGPFFF